MRNPHCFVRLRTGGIILISVQRRICGCLGDVAGNGLWTSHHLGGLLVARCETWRTVSENGCTDFPFVSRRKTDQTVERAGMFNLYIPDAEYRHHIDAEHLPSWCRGGQTS